MQQEWRACNTRFFNSCPPPTFIINDSFCPSHMQTFTITIIAINSIDIILTSTHFYCFAEIKLEQQLCFSAKQNAAHLIITVVMMLFVCIGCQAINWNYLKCTVIMIKTCLFHYFLKLWHFGDMSDWNRDLRSAGDLNSRSSRATMFASKSKSGHFLQICCRWWRVKII